MTTAANLSQSKFRGRTDTNAVDGTPTWAAAVITNWAQATDTPFRIRFLIQNTTNGTPTAGMTVKLQASKNGGTFQDVTTTSTIVKAVDAGASADETIINTPQLAGTGTYAPGRYDETGSIGAGTTIASSGNTEYEFGIQINAADVALNDAIFLKVVTVGGSTITATTTPTITAATTHNLPAARGSYGLTGQPAGLIQGWHITAAQGSYSWRIADQVTIDTGLLAASGSYTRTGNAANLNPPGIRNTNFPAARGSYSWQIADLVKIDTGLRSVSGSYALTGNAANSTRILTADSGLYSINGATGYYDASLSVNFFGSYSITGNAAGLTKSTRAPAVLPAAMGSYAVSGRSANLARLLRAITATYGLTGSAAIYQRTMVAPTGLYSRTGNPAGLAKAVPPSTSLGSVAGIYGLSRIAAPFRRTFLAASGSYTQTGSTATFRPPAKLTAQAGSYILGGHANLLARVLSATGGAYVLNGQPIVLRQSTSVMIGESGDYAMLGSLLPLEPRGVWIESIKQVETWT